MGKSAKRTIDMMKLKLVFTFAAISGLLFASCADSYEVHLRSLKPVSWLVK